MSWYQITSQQIAKFTSVIGTAPRIKVLVKTEGPPDDPSLKEEHLTFYASLPIDMLFLLKDDPYYFQRGGNTYFEVDKVYSCKANSQDALEDNLEIEGSDPKCYLIAIEKDSIELLFEKITATEAIAMIT